MILLLLACLKPAPPVFAVEVEPWAAPPSIIIEERANECPTVDIYPDEPIESLACYGHVIPVSLALELTADTDARDYWRARSEHTERWRLEDRAYCDVAYSAKWTESEQLRHRASVLEVSVAAAFIGGIVVGGAAGVAYTRAVTP